MEPWLSLVANRRRFHLAAALVCPPWYSGWAYQIPNAGAVLAAPSGNLGRVQFCVAWFGSAGAGLARISFRPPVTMQFFPSKAVNFHVLGRALC